MKRDQPQFVFSLLLLIIRYINVRYNEVQQYKIIAVFARSVVICLDC